jgi:RNA polymerase sigma-70 factor (ECF subfamily)
MANPSPAFETTDLETRAAARLDDEAFTRLYEESFDSVYRYAFVLTGDATQAEDLTADVYLQAWRSRDAYRGDGSPLSWLLAMTHNSAMSAHRRQARREAVHRRLDWQRAAPSPELGAVAADDAERLYAALRQLSWDHQIVILLRFFEGRSHGEVGELLDRAPQAVRALQYRALKKLRELLRD